MKRLLEKVKTCAMAVVPVPITMKGISDWMSAGTTALGLGTALLGFVTAIVILLWWIKKYKNEK